MNEIKRHLFRSERLGFRTWLETDIDIMAELNADERVMEHFPFTLTREETANLLLRLNNNYEKNGYTYFAVEELSTNELTGFIGISYQDYKSKFNPSVDIGWRLKPSSWGKGFATEGAKRVLQFAFDTKGLDRIIAVCTVGNVNSMNVMNKIGMTRKGEFQHSKLHAYPAYSTCVWYEITKDKWREIY